MNIINRKNLAHTTFLDLNETTYLDKSGSTRKWVWAQRPFDQQAVVIAATLGDCLVLIKEYRIPLESYIYELPAGLVDPDEDPLKAGCREFEEETGFTIKELIRPISPMIASSPGLTDEAVRIIFAKAEDTGKKPAHGASEDIEVLIYSRAAVADLLRDPNVRIGSRAYFVYLHFATFGNL